MMMHRNPKQEMSSLELTTDGLFKTYSRAYAATEKTPLSPKHFGRWRIHVVGLSRFTRCGYGDRIMTFFPGNATIRL